MNCLNILMQSCHFYSQKNCAFIFEIDLRRSDGAKNWILGPLIIGGRFYVNAALAQALEFQSYFKHLRCFGRGYIIRIIGPGGNMKRQNRFLCHFQESSERILNILDLEYTCLIIIDYMHFLLLLARQQLK